MKTLFLILIAAMFGLLAVLLLPVVYVAWLQWQEIQRNTPHRCDAGAAPSPTDVEQAFASGAQADDIAERFNEMFDAHTLLEEIPLPDVFESWLREYRTRKGKK